MAREIIVKTWCDLHLAQDEHIEGTEIPPLALTPGKPRILALCDVHRKEIYEPLAEALAELGQVVGDDKPAKERKPGQHGGDFKCPVEGCDYTGPSRGALLHHVRLHHDTTLAELEGKPTPHAYADCDRQFATTHALAIHRSRAHVESDVIICPECDKRFTTAKGLGAHRSRLHGVAGTSASAISARGKKKQPKGD